MIIGSTEHDTYLRLTRYDHHVSADISLLGLYFHFAIDFQGYESVSMCHFHFMIGMRRSRSLNTC